MNTSLKTVAILMLNLALAGNSAFAIDLTALSEESQKPVIKLGQEVPKSAEVSKLPDPNLFLDVKPLSQSQARSVEYDLNESQRRVISYGAGGVPETSTLTTYEMTGGRRGRIVNVSSADYSESRFTNGKISGNIKVKETGYSPRYSAEHILLAENGTAVSGSRKIFNERGQAVSSDLVTYNLTLDSQNRIQGTVSLRREDGTKSEQLKYGNGILLQKKIDIFKNGTLVQSQAFDFSGAAIKYGKIISGEIRSSLFNAARQLVQDSIESYREGKQARHDIVRYDEHGAVTEKLTYDLSGAQTQDGTILSGTVKVVRSVPAQSETVDTRIVYQGGSIVLEDQKVYYNGIMSQRIQSDFSNVLSDSGGGIKGGEILRVTSRPNGTKALEERISFRNDSHPGAIIRRSFNAEGQLLETIKYNYANIVFDDDGFMRSGRLEIETANAQDKPRHGRTVYFREGVMLRAEETRYKEDGSIHSIAKSDYSELLSRKPLNGIIKTSVRNSAGILLQENIAVYASGFISSESLKRYHASGALNERVEVDYGEAKLNANGVVTGGEVKMKSFNAKGVPLFNYTAKPGPKGFAYFKLDIKTGTRSQISSLGFVFNMPVPNPPAKPLGHLVTGLIASKTNTILDPFTFVLPQMAVPA